LEEIIIQEIIIHKFSVEHITREWSEDQEQTN
jgi:hypothetical protein